MMQDSHTIGEWFLPGSSHKLPGRLLYNDTKKQIILEFISNSHLDGNTIMGPAPKDPRYHTRFPNRLYKANHPVILGSTPEEITLYYCQISSVTKIGKDLHQIQYVIQYVLFGIHIVTLTEMRVLSGTVLYPYMGCWYDSDGFSASGNSFGNPMPFLDRSDYIGPSTITCREGMNIVISDLDTSHHRHENGVYLYKDKSTQFNYRNPVPFNDLIRDALTFRKLLEFAFGRPLYFQLQELQMIQNGQTLHIPIWNVSHHKGQEIPNLTRHQRYMIISDWNTDRKTLNSAIQKWFENQQYHVLYDYYIDSNHRFKDNEILLTNVMFNNRVLNLIQGLDSYHKNTLQEPEPMFNENERKEFQENKEAVVAILKKIGNTALKDWMQDRVTYRKVASKPQPKIIVIIEEVITSIRSSLDPGLTQTSLFKEFPQLARDIRDDLSHGHHKETSQGPKMHLIFQVGQIILATCILRSLEVPDIPDKIRRYSPFMEYISEILSHKPPAAPSIVV